MTAPDAYEELMAAAIDMHDAVERAGQAGRDCLDLDFDDRVAASVLLIGLQNLISMLSVALLVDPSSGRGLLRQLNVIIASTDTDELRERMSS